ncbi:conserved membrane hypothetical protein [Bradyrhizobium sp. STM 3843]|nr:conserved membrane hypothetical protein [Bradyrhizobium sp. STM 3843]
MRLPSTSAKLMAWAGLVIGGVIWAANTQLGDILSTRDCIATARPSTLISFAGMLIMLASATISWRLDSRPSIGDDRSLPFASRLSALSALVFAFAVALQGAASLVLSGCER